MRVPYTGHAQFEEKAATLARVLGAGHDEALALLAPGSHRLVIADVLLPDGTGHTVAERAKELGIKAILMSGHPDEVHSLFISHVLHLAKPFSLDEFHRLIAEHIGGPRPA